MASKTNVLLAFLVERRVGCSPLGIDLEFEYVML